MPILQDLGGGRATGVPDGPAGFLAEDNQLAEARRPILSADRKHFDVLDWRPPNTDDGRVVSPDAADTPRSLVPAACFPTNHPTDFMSFSERARPGSFFDDTFVNTEGATINDLTNSLASLTFASSGSSSNTSNSQARFSMDADNINPSWLSDRNNLDPPINRRASFYGAPRVRIDKIAYWEGSLPSRTPDPAAGLSSKVFLGGLPWDITEVALRNALKEFVPVRVEWPTSRSGSCAEGGQRGFVYVTLESERRVRALLAASRRHRHYWFYPLSSRKMRRKEVQVIPWFVSEAWWVVQEAEAEAQPPRLQAARTVFLGGLHGLLTAPALAHIMQHVFGGVLYAGIDMDRNKYPIGSGRVTFNNSSSYVRAISVGYLEICSDKFSKKVQINPYLEDSMCSSCRAQQGPYFCREPSCFQYFCLTCWRYRHAGTEHTALTRTSKHSALTPAPPAPAAPLAPLAPPAPLPNAVTTPSSATDFINGILFPHNDADSAWNNS